MFFSNMIDNDKDSNRENLSGFSLFSLVIKERYLDLVSLNLIFILYCLPIFTIGPAVKALSKVTMDFARDQLVSPIYDFKQEFKRGFLNTLLVAFLFFFVYLLMLISLRYYIITLVDSSLNIIFIILNLFLFAITVLTFIFYFKSVELFELSKKEILKNAFILAFTKPLYLIGLIICMALLCFLFLRFKLIIVFLFCLFLFAFISLVTSFLAWHIFEKAIAIED